MPREPIRVSKGSCNRRDQKFESRSLHRRVHCEPDAFDQGAKDSCWFPAAGFIDDHAAPKRPAFNSAPFWALIEKTLVVGLRRIGFPDE